MVNIKFNDFIRSVRFIETKNIKLNYKIGDKKFEGEKNV